MTSDAPPGWILTRKISISVSLSVKTKKQNIYTHIPYSPHCFLPFLPAPFLSKGSCMFKRASGSLSPQSARSVSVLKPSLHFSAMPK